MNKKQLLKKISRTNSRLKILGAYGTDNYKELLGTIEDPYEEICILIQDQHKAFQCHLAEQLLTNGIKIDKFADIFLDNCIKEDIPELIGLFNKSTGFKANEIAKKSIDYIDNNYLYDLFEELLHCESFDVNKFAEQGINKCKRTSEVYSLMHLMEENKKFDTEKHWKIAEKKASDILKKHTRLNTKNSPSKQFFTHS